MSPRGSAQVFTCVYTRVCVCVLVRMYVGARVSMCEGRDKASFLG